MNNVLQIPVSMLPDGSITPSPVGQAVAEVVFSTDPSGSKTALIRFAGMNQALATYDALGNHVVSFTPYDITGNAAIDRSIRNIINHICNPR